MILAVAGGVEVCCIGEGRRQVGERRFIVRDAYIWCGTLRMLSLGEKDEGK